MPQFVQIETWFFRIIHCICPVGGRGAAVLPSSHRGHPGGPVPRSPGHGGRRKLFNIRQNQVQPRAESSYHFVC